MGDEELSAARDRVMETLGRVRSPLTRAVEDAVHQVGQLEASVRSSPDGLRGGRIMIEQATVGVAVAVADVIGIGIGQRERMDRLLTLATDEGLPLIIGWDVGRSMIKLYLNASDVATATRARVAEAFDVSSPRVLSPHIIGLNIGKEQEEVKLYVQDEDVEALASTLGSSAEMLAQAAALEGAAAAGVVAYDFGSRGPSPRAFFVALRDRDPIADWSFVESLGGWSRKEVHALIPFTPGAVRSIGVPIDGGRQPTEWTVYYKPAAGDRPVNALEPTVTYRAGEVEVGVFVEPTERAARAYARTNKHAVSVRTRQGAPPRDALERLMVWVVARMRAEEDAGVDPIILRGTPPPPWRGVDD